MSGKTIIQGLAGLLAGKDTNVVTGKNGVMSLIKEKSLENGISYKRTAGVAVMGMASVDFMSNGFTTWNLAAMSIAILLPYVGKSLLNLTSKQGVKDE